MLAVVAPIVVFPLNVLVPATLTTPVAVKLVVVRFVAVIAFVYKFAQTKLELPKL